MLVEVQKGFILSTEWILSTEEVRKVSSFFQSGALHYNVSGGTEVVIISIRVDTFYRRVQKVSIFFQSGALHYSVSGGTYILFIGFQRGFATLQQG